MKKKLLMMVLAACMGFSMFGCSDKTDDETNGNNSETDTRTTFEILDEVDIEEYLTLGNYKGLELEKTVAVVTDKEIDDEIEAALEAYPVEVKDRTDVQKGDTVNIDYVGRMDGEEFEGGSYEGFDLLIGSGQFIYGFEDGLIGAEVGETVVLDLNFPDPYQNNPDLAGDPVEFTVTINSISAPLEEITDEWVADNVTGCSTIEEYRETLGKMLAEANEVAADEQLVYSAWTNVVEATTIHQYEEILLERGEEAYRDNAEYYASYAGMELEAYVEYCGLTMDEFEQNAVEYGKNLTTHGMIVYAICQKEGIEVGGEEYEAELASILEEYDCTEEELFSYYDRDTIEQTIMLNCVCNLLIEEAEVTEVESSEDAE